MSEGRSSTPPSSPVADELDLGDGHRIVFAEYEGEARVGGNVKHPPVEGKCSGDGWISFEGRAWARQFKTPAAVVEGRKREPVDPLAEHPVPSLRGSRPHPQRQVGAGMSDIDGFTSTYACDKCKRRAEGWQYIGNAMWCGECLRDEVVRLRTQSESVAWVACAVRLPEGDADVLAIDRDGKMHGKQAHSVRTDAAFAVRSGNKPFYTHWMPLPEAPK
jgi:hypothetical protein